MNVKEQPWSTGCVFLMFWCTDDDKNILMRSETMTSVCLRSALFQFLFGLSPILCIFWFAPCCVQPTTPITAMTQRPSSRRSLRVRTSLSSSSAHGHIYVVAVCGRSGFTTCSAVLSRHRLSAIWLSCTKDPDISIRGTSTCTHGVDWCLLGDKCVAGMVIRKKINMHARCTSVSLCVSLSQYLQHNWSTYN